MATVSNTTSNTLVTGTSGADSIYNGGRNVTIDTGAGNDTVYNYGTNVSISTGDGNDSVYNGGSNVTINTGASNDSVYNYGTNVSISTGDGNDSVYNSGSNVTIRTGAGNDSVYLYDNAKKNVIQYAYGDGIDTVYGYNPTDTVSLTNCYVTSTVASGNNLIVRTSSGSIVFVNTKAVNVNGTIYGNTSTTGTSGNDVITNFASNTTINGYGGNDLLVNGGANVSIHTGDGNYNTVKNYGSNATIQTGSGLWNYVYNYESAKINGGAGRDYVCNYSESVSVDGGAGNDYIYNPNGSKNSKLIGGDGDDTIGSWGEGRVTIDGGTGNDSIYSANNTNGSVSGGAGNDTIYNYSSNITISGGTGNDFISLSSYTKNDLIRYAAGDGNDSIVGFKTTDTLLISGANSFTSVRSGSDIIVSVGTGKVTLKGAANLSTVNVLIEGTTPPDPKRVTLTNGNDTYYNTVNGATILALASNDYVTNTGSSVSIDGGSGNDYIYNTGAYSTILGSDGADTVHNYAVRVSIDGGVGNDYIYSNNSSYREAYATINAGDGNDTIIGKFGDSSVNAGAGNDLVSLSGDVDRATIIGGTGNDTVYMDNYDGRNVYQYTSGDGNDLIYHFRAADTLRIGNGTTDTFTSVKGSSDVVIAVGDGSITLSGAASLSTLNVAGKYVPSGIISLTPNDDTYSNAAAKVTILALGGNDRVTNTGASVSIDGGTGNDYISSSNNSFSKAYVTINAGEGNDTVVGLFGDSSVNGGAGADLISVAGDIDRATINPGTGNDTVYMDNYDGRNVYQYTSGDGNDLIYYFRAADTLRIGNGTTDTFTSVKSGSDVVISVGEGNITLSGAASLSTLNVAGNYVPSGIISLTPGNDTYSNTASKVTILALAGNDTISNTGAGVSIDGGAGNDSIESTGESVSIDGGAGNDYIYTPNRGSNYGKNSKILGGEGDDNIYNMLIGNVTIDGGAGNDSIVSYNNWYNSTSIAGGAGDDTITVSNNSTNSYTATINGGIGNDKISLASDASKDIIEYAAGDGNDSIVGFSTLTTLKIGNGTTDTFTSVKSGSNVVIGVGDGSITLSGAASLSTLNVAGTYVPPTPIPPPSGIISLTANNDTYSNNFDSVTVLALGGNDSITNTGASVSLDGGAGNDNLYNNAAKVTINASTGNDSIALGSTAANNLLVYKAGDGFDTISGYKTGDSVSIVGSSKYVADTVDNNIIISLSGGGMTLEGANNQSISIKGGKVVSNKGISVINYVPENPINGTARRDTITNYASDTTILAGAGNDYIYNSTTSDYLANDEHGHVTIDGGAGNDTILSYDPNVSISGGANADFISLKSSNFGGVTVNGGTGNDTIYGNANNYGVLYQYAAGDGFDVIHNFSTNDTLSIAGGDYTSEVAGENVLVSVEGGGMITLVGAANKSVYIYPPKAGNGKYIINYNNNTLLSGSTYADTIKNYGNAVTIAAGAGNDSIDGSNDYATINAGAGNDTVTGNHYHSKLSGDSGNDLISISTYSANTLDGGEGNDTIIAGGNYHSVNGGAGADKISLSGDRLTVKGGTGNDTLYGDTTTSHLYQYAKGDGNDLIYNYGSQDSITISGADEWSTILSGNDVIVSVQGSGNMTLVGAKGKTLNIYPAPYTNPTVPTDVTAQDVIKNFMKSLDTTDYSGKAAIDQAVSVATGGYFSNVKAATDQMIVDCQTYTTANSSTGWKNFLLEKCGIDLDNADTGAITGSDAGGSSVKTAQSIVPEEGNLDNFTGNTFTVNGLTVQLASIDSSSYNPSDINYSALTDNAQRYIWQAFKTWWAKGALDLNAQSYGDNYSFAAPSATAKKLSFGFVNENSGLMAVTGGWYANYPSHKTIDKLIMAVNIHNYSSIIEGNVDGKTTTNNGYYLDRVLAHEFTHALMYANVNYAGDLPNYIMEGMAELTHGTDDDRKSEITTLAKSPSSLRYALNYDVYDSYAGGYMFLRYLAKQGAENYPASNNGSVFGNMSVSDSNADNLNTVHVQNALLTVSKDFTNNAIDLTNYDSAVKNVDATALANGIEITGNTNANSIAGGVGNDTVFANVGNDTVLGGKGNDVLYGEAGDDKIFGDDGDDTLSGGTGNDTLTGGEGNDLFLHVADNDLIVDYTAGQDKIKLAKGNVVSSSVSGSDAVLDTGIYGAITLKGGKDVEITVIDGDDNEYTTVISGESDTTYYDNASPTNNTLASDIVTGDASARTKAIKVIGNALDNSIIGGTGKDSLYGKDGDDYLYGGTGSDKLWGQNGNDTLWGGTGNDTLTGGNGNDLFIYSAGKDVIADYAAGDKISIGAAISKATVSGSNVVLTVGSGSLTVKNAKDKTLSLITSTGSELSTIIGASKVTYTDSDAAKVTMPSAIAIGDASARTTAIRITGNSLNNTILGGAGKDSINGGSGADSLSGGVGNDSIRGGSGNDILLGDAGNDKLYADAGNDTLWGGTGNDTLYGGDGADTFCYVKGDGKDVIYGFGDDDLLAIMGLTGKVTGTFNSAGTQLTVKVGSTAVAVLKNFSATTFNVSLNGTNHQITK